MDGQPTMAQRLAQQQVAAQQAQQQAAIRKQQQELAEATMPECERRCTSMRRPTCDSPAAAAHTPLPATVAPA